MKNIISIAFIGLVVLTAIATVASASNEIMIRGQVTNLSVPEFTYNASNFPGFTTI